MHEPFHAIADYRASNSKDKIEHSLRCIPNQGENMYIDIS